MDLYTHSHILSIWEKISVYKESSEKRDLAIGVDGVSSVIFNRNLEKNIDEIVRKINRGLENNCTNYHFAPLINFEYLKSSGGVRNIYIPRLRDQIVFRAMHDDIVLSANKFGLRLKLPSPSKIILAFREQIIKFSNPFVLRTDIRSFYDSIPREIVVEKLLNIDLHSITKILLKEWSPKVVSRKPLISGKNNDVLVSGLPQGLSISASMSEFWLSEIDKKYVGCNTYFRYADDIAIICESYEKAILELDLLKFYSKELGLQLSSSKTLISSLENGISWLGLKHYSNCLLMDENRLFRWLKKISKEKKQLVRFVKNNNDCNKNKILQDFITYISKEISGRTNSKIYWYIHVTDLGQWKRFDSSLHNLIKSLSRFLDISLDQSIKLPSLHYQIAIRKGRLNKNTSPINAS
jgi:RNA-directed DNA polymerase